jgi:tRNA-specific adenosine deaminase 2
VFPASWTLTTVLAFKNKMNQSNVEFLMEEAFKMAEEAYSAGEVPIGCVIASQKQPLEILAAGRNMTNEKKNGTRHAELEALDRLTYRNPVSYPELILAVTIEPCIMCAALLRSLGFGQVYYGAGNERFGGCGSIFPAHSTPNQLYKPLSVESVESHVARNVNLLRKFYLRENDRAPPEKKKLKVNRKFKEFVNNKYV